MPPTSEIMRSKILASLRKHRQPATYAQLLEECLTGPQALDPEIDAMSKDVIITVTNGDDGTVINLSCSTKVFIVHGHDVPARQVVADFVSSRLGLDPVILQEQPSTGKTTIEKLLAHSAPSFVVVLLTPDDSGYRAGHPEESKPRARQNVVLELGFFVGKIGRSRVCSLCKGDVEIPSDYHGVVYVRLDSEGAWKIQLAREMQASGTVSSPQLLSFLKRVTEWEGKAVKGNARDDVYLVHKGIRHHVVDTWNHVVSLGLTPANLLRVTQDDINALPEGSPVDSETTLARILAT